MHAPQIITMVLLSMNVGMNLIKHGEPKDDHYSFPIALASAGINVALLWWGGFFG